MTKRSYDVFVDLTADSQPNELLDVASVEAVEQTKAVHGGVGDNSYDSKRTCDTSSSIGASSSASLSMHETVRSCEACVDFVGIIEGIVRPKNPKIEVFCPIMQSEYPQSECCTLNCKYAHQFSLDALAGHMRSTLMHESEGISAPYLTACPLANVPHNMADMKRCDYALDQTEIETVLNKLLEKGLLASEDAETMWATAKDLFLARAHRVNGHIRCISCSGRNNEGVWFDISEADSQQEAEIQFIGVFSPNKGCANSSSSSSGAVRPAAHKRRVVCPVCSAQFCGDCNSIPYHYGCRCDELIDHVRASLEWVESGRDAYINKAAVQSEEYFKLLSVRKARSTEAKEARERYQQLVLDEKYKAKTCKMCPHCGRVIEKLSGCDHMVCGTDASGGNAQKGCGKRFSWNSAPKYAANVGGVGAPSSSNLAAPSRDPKLLHEHMLCEGVPLCCDLCQNAIVGARLKCLHCVSFNMCLTCSINIGHEIESKHLCTVIFEPEI